MAEVPLRSYLHEIEKDIESGRTDQAIAHSRHILQTYSKYVDAYRLLGKSFLESQRYTDAGDIFQRVLSSIPDDFVAHVGMSIIREDEGNIDEAIWHMERAFEVQPSNNAIQGELRRLFGRRDNVEPPKIRLTRGALARLYYKGELYQQAISEIRAALNEAPTRLDLQALLADIYIKTGQPADATDTALNVLNHLPNCLVANRVMIQVLKGTDHEADLQVYQQRMAQLDPYSAFISQNYPDSESVPVQAVQIEKLDWKPDQSMTGISQPDWAASLGVDIGEMAPTSDQPLPDWLDDMSLDSVEQGTAPSDTPAAAAFGDDIQTAELDLPLPEQISAAEAESVPDWLRDAGWQATLDSADQPKLDLDPGKAAKIIKSDEDIASAEIPDWLLAMAPPEETETESVSEGDLTPWLENIIPSAQKPAGEIEEEIIPEASTPDWLIEASLAGAGAALAADQPSKEPAISDEEAIEADLVDADQFENVPSEAITFESTPDWLLEMQQLEPEENVSAEADSEIQPELEQIPDSILDAAGFTEADLSEEEQKPAGQAAQAFPSWLMDDSDSEPLSGPGLAKQDLYEAEAGVDLPDWLKTIEPEAMAPLETASDFDTPAWLLETETTSSETQTPSEEPQMEPHTQVEAPDWIQEIEAMPEQVNAGAVVPADIPDWLLETNQEQPVEEQLVEEISPSEESGGDIPDWLLETSQDQLVEEQLVEEVSLPEESGGDIPAWLREARQDQSVEDLTVEQPHSSEETQIEIPDWLKAAVTTESDITEEAFPEMETVEQEPIEPATELPDWLLDMQTPPLQDTQPTQLEQVLPSPKEEEPQPTADQDSLQEAFAWLMGLGATATAADSARESSPQPPQTEARLEEELVEFQEEMIPEMQAPGITEKPIAGETSLGEVLPTPEPEQPHAEMTAEAQPDQFSKEALGLDEDLTDQDAAFAWLESLAVKQGASEALLLSPEERSETMPEWVMNDVKATQAAQDIEVKAELEEIPSSEAIAEDEELQIETPVAAEVEEEPIEAISPEIESEVEPLGEWQEAAEEAEQEIEKEIFIPADEIEKPGAWELTAEEEALADKTETLEPQEPRAWEEAAKEAELLVSDETPEAEKEIPPLPDWLTESAISPHEEIEWTPPPVPQRRYDLNEASLSELERLPGLGFVTAQKITDYRDLHGPFESLEDLLLIPDFNDPMLDAVRDFLFVKPVVPIAPPVYEEPLQLSEDEEISAELLSARTDLTQNHLERALEQYAKLIRSNKDLKQIVQDLHEAAFRYPDDFDVWQNLGDAQLRLNNVQEALEAYIKAEQLIEQ